MNREPVKELTMTDEYLRNRIVDLEAQLRQALDRERVGCEVNESLTTKLIEALVWWVPWLVGFVLGAVSMLLIFRVGRL